MQYGAQRQTGQPAAPSQPLGAPHPQSNQVIYGPLTAAQRPLVHCATRRHPQPRAIFTQVPVMQYQYNQRQPTPQYIPAQPPTAGPYSYQTAPSFPQYQQYYTIQTSAASIHQRGPQVPLQMGHAGHPQPPHQTQPTAHSQTPTTSRQLKSRAFAIPIINPDTLSEVNVNECNKSNVEEEATPVVSACDGPSVEIPLEHGRRKAAIPIVDPKDNKLVKQEEPSVTTEVEPIVEDLPAVEPVIVEEPQTLQLQHQPQQQQPEEVVEEILIEEKKETDETDRGATMLVEEIGPPPSEQFEKESPKEPESSSCSSNNKVEEVVPVPEQEVVVAEVEEECAKEEPQEQKDVQQVVTECEVEEPSVTLSNQENDAEEVGKEEVTAEEEAAPTVEAPKSLITYNEGQWSPLNPNGECKYDRTQLLQLREAKLSSATPILKNKKVSCIVSGPQGRSAPNNSLMPTFAKKGQSIGSYSSNNPSMPAFVKPQGGAPSMRNSSKGSKSGMIHVHLSLREEIKLNESENAWKPTHLTADKTAEEDLKKRVRGILNRLTPEKFDVLVSEIMNLQIDTSTKLNDVMILVFEKAIDEPNFSASYASLCRSLATDIIVKDSKNDNVHFRSVLIDKTEGEFFRNVTDKDAKDKKLEPLIKKLKESTSSSEKADITAAIEEEERKFRRRSVGTVTFIGELYKIGMLTPNIISICIRSLLDPDSEDKLECVCKLLTTVGKKYDETSQNPQPAKKDGQQVVFFSLDNCVKQMQMITCKRIDASHQISSRVRFMLQDVIDLRRNKWIPSQTKQDGPKTMDQISKEAKNEQINTSYLNYGSQSQHSHQQQQKNGGGGSGGGARYNMGNNFNRNSGSGNRMGGDRNMNNQDQSEWITQTSKNNSKIDTNKLDAMCLNTDTTRLGPVQPYWKYQNNNKSTPPVTSNSFAALNLLDNKHKDDQQPRMHNYGNKKNSYNKNSYDRDRSLSRSNRSQEYSSTQRQSSQHQQSQQQQQHHHHQQQQQQQQQPIGKQFKSQASITKLKHPQKAPAANFAELSYDDTKNIGTAINKIIENSIDALNFDETLPIFLAFPDNQRWGFIFCIFYDYLHLAKVTGTYRTTAAEFIVYLLNHNYISLEHLAHGYKSFSEIASDLLLDVPEAWHYIFECAIILIAKNIINILDLWNDDLRSNNMGKKFIKEYLNYSVRHIGPSFTQTNWKELNLSWSMFLKDEDIDSFIKSNNFEFVEDYTQKPVIVVKTDPELHIQAVMVKTKYLLHNGYNSDSIIDYFKGNIVDVNKSFIHALTTTLAEYAISETSPTVKLDPEQFKRVVKILQYVLDSNPHRELECLFALQLLTYSLEHPPNFLSLLFNELSFADVISADSFYNWKESKEYPNAGKGVALMGLRAFFDELESAETSDEDNSKSRADNASAKSGSGFRKNKQF